VSLLTAGAQSLMLRKSRGFACRVSVPHDNLQTILFYQVSISRFFVSVYLPPQTYADRTQLVV
jgi:hypothetical protein